MPWFPPEIWPKPQWAPWSKRNQEGGQFFIFEATIFYIWYYSQIQHTFCFVQVDDIHNTGEGTRTSQVQKVALCILYSQTPFLTCLCPSQHLSTFPLSANKWSTIAFSSAFYWPSTWIYALNCFATCNNSNSSVFLHQLDVFHNSKIFRIGACYFAIVCARTFLGTPNKLDRV